MRALVTGAAGFVGSHLVAHLQAEGDEVAESETEIIDNDGLVSEFCDYQPEVVYHLAALADVGGSWNSAASTIRVNVEGTYNVLAAARDAEAGRVVAVTSADIYGHVDESDLPITESTAIRPVSPYAASKAAAEMVCIQAGLGAGLDVVRARSFNHLGPGQTDKFVASAIACRIAANERSGASSVRVGNLEARRDFTDVRDVVRAYRLLAQGGAKGEAYNVCTGVDHGIREVAEMLVGNARSPMELETDPDLLRPVDLKVLRGDCGKLHAATGWKPELALDTTLADLLDYWRTTGPEVGSASPT